MLQNTFCHIPGISRGTELNLWQNDLLHWQDVVDNHHKIAGRKEVLMQGVHKSIDAHQTNNHNFFLQNLQGKDHWRVYQEFKNKCCFLDIETTGLNKTFDDVTVVGMYNGQESKIFVKGKNMHLFEEEIKKYPLLVSFNGRCFDVPFLKAKFPSVNFDKFHIDLRFALKDLGYSGGLKRIEGEFDIKRDDDLQEVDGFEAVRLWRRYMRGDEKALDLLVKYNKADIENLKVLMDAAFAKLKEKHFFRAIG